VRVPQDAVIGYDLDRDRQHHYVSESGIVVINGDRTPVDITALVVSG
jgi:glucose-1-phosphate adenylyltransferase